MKFLALILLAVFSSQAFALRCQLAHQAAGQRFAKRMVLKVAPTPRMRMLMVGEIGDIYATYLYDLASMSETLSLVSVGGQTAKKRYQMGEERFMEVELSANGNFSRLECTRN